ncbi:DNA-binding protein [Scytonema hofmannii PCC 7110]|uniref:DNA-binding protein n=1 Tax=Scytonema hofmannii PCC 7110 TaxID=128403 RepID=A0A139XHS1_9CYAN|nr:RodZ domain-containing protein [Scytonema hofmannii]KYC44244.1 DNA-binding protein [Scytonema hofmannii PCC 7110]
MKWLKRKNKRESTPSPDQQRAEVLAEMGAQLWTRRLEKGLSLEEMVIVTKISRRLLQAIEEGNLSELPEPVYTQGLIRQYADALGFHGVQFSSSYPIGTNRVNFKPIWKTTSDQLRPVHLYVLYIFVIFGSISGLSQFLNTATLQASSSPNNQKVQKARVLESHLTQNKNVQLQTFSQSYNEGQQVQIGVTLKEKSWIKVVADGKIQYEGELPEGTHRIWKAQEQLTVKAGNAGGVLVSVNKEEAKQLGEPGTAKEVTIAAVNPS